MVSGAIRYETFLRTSKFPGRSKGIKIADSISKFLTEHGWPLQCHAGMRRRTGIESSIGAFNERTELQRWGKEEEQHLEARATLSLSADTSL